MSLRLIQQMVGQGRYRLTRHAWEAGRARQITIQDVEDSIASGQVIETHTDDWDFRSYLIAGERFNGDVIHVACKIVDDVVQINTVYFPHPGLWEGDDRVRKR